MFGECKTFNKFKQRDIDRMQLIADSFPDAILVVATLAEGFSDEEKLCFCRSSRRAEPTESLIGRAMSPLADGNRAVLRLRTAIMLAGEVRQGKTVGGRAPVFLQLA